ncbi:MAG: thioesterase [Sphaerospermopsis sp. SIO1G2]|nr:thioesterase [Sphaerospermopsis sp. SIO1G2]
MTHFQIHFSVRWSELDPNYHVRHTQFSNYASETRIAFFVNCGLMPNYLQEHNIGPILFHEEIFYYNEVTLGDTVTVNCLVTATSENASKVKIRNEIFSTSGKKAAMVNSTTMWLDLTNRKIVKPPAQVAEVFTQLLSSAV